MEPVVESLGRQVRREVIEKEVRLIGASVEEQRLLHNDTSYLDCFR